MGVPKFYRWLSERYPKINQLVSTAALLPEIDNFYLDMNGIIHSCTHPNNEDISHQLTEREMMLGIFRYIERMVTEIVKPKRLLFMAVDGVAPRAKLNQQRARRFRSAKDTEENVKTALAKGVAMDVENLFDSNCITPGTEFMAKVGAHLVYFIRQKIKEDPLWQNLEVVFSGHDVPGEGEHKIMQYIRELRVQPDYDPNTRHCMYGQDADLIMLGLSTHEPHFVLLREVINFRTNRPSKTRQVVMQQSRDASFQLLHLSVLREYILMDLCWALDSAAFESERVIDDFVFLTFFVGNDFLPHLPTLDIGEGAFSMLFTAYKTIAHPGTDRKQWRYLVRDGEIENLRTLEEFMALIGSEEGKILKEREKEIANFNRRRRRFDSIDGTQTAPTLEEEEETELTAQAEFEAALRKRQGEETPWDDIAEAADERKNTDSEDAVALQHNSTKDYKGRYYYDKFKKTALDTEFHTYLHRVYLEGLMWCLAYYVKGCVSWTWYYPEHYGPMLSDMSDLETLASSIRFELGQPFAPFEQLLGCLPPASGKLLPEAYRWLMTSSESPIRDCYPSHFSVDMDGKRNPWEAVVLLPFIDERRLLEACVEHCDTSRLSPSERMRNAFGYVKTFRFDPASTERVVSVNPAIGLPDLGLCLSVCESQSFNLSPCAPFVARLRAGCVTPIPGFPTLHALSIVDVRLQPVKVNVFGSESKYPTLVLKLDQPAAYATVSAVEPDHMVPFLGQVVYVNYPSMHEAQIVAVCTTTFEVRKDSTSSAGYTIRTCEEPEQDKRSRTNNEERHKYLHGNGTVGSGGLDIGPVYIRLRVLPLQGMKIDRSTGACTKVFGTEEADVPMQLALDISRAPDPRFTERGAQSVEQLFPRGCTVACVEGPFKGLCGTVAGHATTEGKADERCVEVELLQEPREDAFGIEIAASVKDTYYKSFEVARVLQISTSILGKITGSLLADPGMHDLGLQLKANGRFYLPGYVRRVASRADVAWTTGESLQVVGMVEQSQHYEREATQWEYAECTLRLLTLYLREFPALFQALSRLDGNARAYQLSDLFGDDGQQTADAIMTWMKAQPFFNLPRVPVTTERLSVEAVAQIEKVQHTIATAVRLPPVRRTVDARNWVRKGSQRPTDTPLELQAHTVPVLGDRVMSLSAERVPFGLKGTVIAIHYSTGYVEVVFDREFTGGSSLGGLCSGYRGRLVSWKAVLRLEPDNHKSTVFNRTRDSASSNMHPQKSIQHSRITATGRHPQPSPVSAPFPRFDVGSEGSWKRAPRPLLQPQVHSGPSSHKPERSSRSSGSAAYTQRSERKPACDAQQQAASIDMRSAETRPARTTNSSQSGRRHATEETVSKDVQAQQLLKLLRRPAHPVETMETAVHASRTNATTNVARKDVAATQSVLRILKRGEATAPSYRSTSEAAVPSPSDEGRPLESHTQSYRDAQHLKSIDQAQRHGYMHAHARTPDVRTADQGLAKATVEDNVAPVLCAAKTDACSDLLEAKSRLVATDTSSEALRLKPAQLMVRRGSRKHITSQSR